MNRYLNIAVTICCLGCTEVARPTPTQADRDAFRELIDTRLELANLLQRVTDERSAREASGKYAEVFTRYKQWTDVTNDIPIARKTPIRRKLQDELNDSMGVLHSQFSRIAALPEAASILRINSR